MDNYDKTHPYGSALEKFHGKVIEVKDVFGDIIRGKCIAIFKPHLNVIIENEDSIIVIKNPQVVRREKDKYPQQVERPEKRVEKLEKKVEVKEEQPVKKKRGRPKKSKNNDGTRTGDKKEA